MALFSARAAFLHEPPHLLHQLNRLPHLCSIIAIGTPIFPYTEQTFSFGGQDVSLCIPEAVAVQAHYVEQPQHAFWSRVWPAAEALCQFIARHTNEIRGKKVWELAAGLGLPSVLAAHWAHSVYCSEQQPAAIPYINLSAIKNGLSNLKAAAGSWEDIPATIDVDILLLSDVNYDPRHFPALQKSLLNIIGQGIPVWLSTPQRLMAKPFVESLLPYCTYREEVLVSKDQLPMQVWILHK